MTSRSLPALVVVCGIDGAGKTTQTRLLVESLADRGLDARAAQTTGPNTRVTGALKRTIAPRFLDREDDLARAGSTATGPASAGGWIFLVRGLWGSWTTVLANATADVLVLDRYLYDDLVRVAWRYGYEESRLVALSRLVPAPALIVRLVAPTAVAWERESDGRTTLAEHEAKRAAYDRVFAALDTDGAILTVDTGEHGVEETRDRLRRAFDTRLSTVAADSRRAQR
ncbi:hypothetical protein [Halovivax cerinus]|uniref:Thymidylate kinase n=1 Tax=Halovivax cerinus TaxID=1487865 RepID=A0ABD5NNS2_9EURY|nr:hypothetical protein [Halovivax cerinus]